MFQSSSPKYAKLASSAKSTAQDNALPNRLKHGRVTYLPVIVVNAGKSTTLTTKTFPLKELRHGAFQVFWSKLPQIRT